MYGRLGIRARAQREALPQAREGKRERTNAPSARVLRPYQACVMLLILLTADDFRSDWFYIDVRMMNIPPFDNEDITGC